MKIVKHAVMVEPSLAVRSAGFVKNTMRSGVSLERFALVAKMMKSEKVGLEAYQLVARRKTARNARKSTVTGECALWMSNLCV